MKNNLTTGANERCKTFVMVKLYKRSLCKWKLGLRSPSVRLKRPSADNARQWRCYEHCVHGFSEVVSSLDYKRNSQLTILCLFPQPPPLCAGLSATCHWVWCCSLEIPGLNCRQVSQNIATSPASQRSSYPQSELCSWLTPITTSMI